MIPKSLMKNPVLVVGILFMFIFLSGLREKGFFGQRAERLTPTSCKATLVMLNKRIPANWATKCDGNNLHVDINSTIDASKLVKEKNALKMAVYRELANSLIFIAKNSPSDNIERTDAVTLTLAQAQIKINAATMGKDIAKFRTLKSEKFIMDHLYASVKVQEIVK